ncbi:MAG: hypothetical protein ACON45_07665 [Paracoccaceae bacterium]
MKIDVPSVPRRDPSDVMRLRRLGSFHQCRLSFMRTLTRRMAKENWQFSKPLFDIDERGVGRAVYSVKGPERTYSLVAFSHDLDDALRSDRVIAEAWDATFTLHDGIPSDEDLDRLEQNVPYQEAGRVSERELTLSRANRSVRLWKHVVDRLANGLQPDLNELEKVGYLMRTTAVYGSGKFGVADRDIIAERPECHVPFQVEMLTVYLIRCFVRDLVEHMARMQGGDAATGLDPLLAKRFGIGNSTGLGMAPFIINHPVLFNNWIMAREEAISRVRSLEHASDEEITLFRRVFEQTCSMVKVWQSEHPIQIEKLKDLRADLETIAPFIASDALIQKRPWDALMREAKARLTEEGQECIASLIMEPYGELVDGISECMADSNKGAFVIDGSATTGQICALIAKNFAWAIDLDWSQTPHCARAWYVSEEKLEPRLGERFEEPITPYEQPLAPARDAALAYHDLKAYDPDTPLSMFLLDYPEHRHTARRALISQVAPYGEIQDNTICASVLPIDMLRAKLSFFGATHFDPRSDRWVRICMYKNAPYPEELCTANADRWVYPELAC